MVTTTQSADETQQLAAELAKQHASKHTIIALKGNLGAGKTTFTQGFAAGLGIEQKIISPTFIIARQYPIPQSEFVFHHIDLYRLETPINLVTTGLQEIFDSPNTIAIIEWSEKISDQQLPAATIIVTIEPTSESKRQITIQE